MINQKTRDEILLYWSGEADAAQEARVQVLLKSDPEARVYFEELGVFDTPVSYTHLTLPTKA